MSERKSVNHLNPNFYTTPGTARQVMTFQEWQETAKAIQRKILACGETYELKLKNLGGGMYEIRAELPYWQNGKPQRPGVIQTPKKK